MIRANIKSSDEVYIGLIDEDDSGFTVIWNKNISAYSGIKISGKSQCFQTYDQACKSVYKAIQDAKISETIYFKHS